MTREFLLHILQRKVTARSNLKLINRKTRTMKIMDQETMSISADFVETFWEISQLWWHPGKVVSKYVAPAAPCDLDRQKKCLLVNTPDIFDKDTVNWLGCDGRCHRWFHVPCLLMNATEFQAASNRKKWYCNRSHYKSIIKVREK